MKFYVSGEPFERLNNEITNLNSYKIIDVDYILNTCGLNPENDVDGYIITTEIKRMIEEGLKCKRCNGVIYINKNLNVNLIYSLKNTLMDICGPVPVDINLFDDREVPKFKEIYKLFDEVIFYSKCKKIKLIECKPIEIMKE